MSVGLRRQLPAYSPLSLRAVRAGFRGLIRNRDALRAAVGQALCARYRAHRALLVDSGTSALRLAFAALRMTEPNRPIALPAYCCYDLATAADGADIRSILYDLDPRTLAPNEISLRRALEREPAAIVGAHLYGFPIEVDLVQRLARDAGAMFIEDAAQGDGGSFAGTTLGSFGSISVLSFGRGKGMTAGGGGALLAHDEMGEAVLSLAARQTGASGRGTQSAVLLAAQWILGRPALYGLPSALPFLHLGETVYHIASEPNEMTAASVHALAAALDAADDEIGHRRIVAHRLMASAQRGGKLRTIHPAELGTPGYLRLPVQMAAVGEFQWRALERHGVARGYPKPLKELVPFQQRVLNRGDDFAGAQTLATSLLTLPTHSRLAERDIRAIEGWLSLSPDDDAATATLLPRPS